MFGAAQQQKTARDYAAVLAPFTHGASVEQVEAFLQATLGPRGGAGLQAVVEAHESAGQVFAAIYALDMLCGIATVNRANCSKLASLARDVIIVLDTAGRKGTAIDEAMLSALAGCIDDCCSLVDGFSQPGWLLRVACNETMREEFVTMHEAVEEILKSDNLGQLPGGRDLPLGDYTNLTKQVRRTLKQLGRGNVNAGVAALRSADSVGAKELAALLEVPASQVASEARRIPEADLDIDVLYKSLLRANPGLAGPLASMKASKGAAGGDEGEEGGQAGEEFRELFDWYDTDKNGTIELPELQRILSDLGMLDGKAAREAAACVESHMRAADPSGRGAISLELFGRWYSTLVMTKARQQLRVRMGLQAEEDLRAAFVAFSSFGTRELARDMDGKALIKLVRDTGLLGGVAGAGGLTPTDVDLIFAKVKSKGARRIAFEQFLCALTAIAEKKNITFEEAVQQVLDAGGPVAYATKADAVRLHDDRSTYTGVYKHGGPTAVDDVFDLATFLDRDRAAAATPGPMLAAAARTPTTVHSSGRAGTPMSATPTPGLAPRRLSTGPMTPTPSSMGSSRRTSHISDDTGAAAGPSSLQDVFASFARFGTHDRDRSAPAGGAAGGPRPPARRFQTFAGTPGSVGKGPATPGAVQMDGARFAKLCREAGLLDGKKLTATGVDLIFAKVKAKGAKKIGFSEFARALQLVADAKGRDLSEVASAVEGCGGPAVGSATTPDAVRFYDDARRTPAPGAAAGGARNG